MLDGFNHQRFRALYANWEHAGLEIKLVKQEEHPNYGMVKGNVYDQSKPVRPVGEVYYNWTRDRDGKIEVEHDFIRLDATYHGRGWASALETHLVDGYRRIGVDRITLTAAKVGAYAWAMQGYEFNEPKTEWEATLRNLSRNNVATPAPGERVRELWGTEVLDKLERFIEHTATSEWEIASWGREHAREVDGVTWWPGKAYLVNNGWVAVKRVS